MKFIYYLCCLFVVVFPVSAADISGQLDEADNLFEKVMQDQGKISFKTTDLDNVISIYEDIVESGYENEGIYYNLGNCYTLKGEVAWAIYHYRKALLISPGNERILNNLQVAKKTVAEVFPTDKNDNVTELSDRILFFHHYQINSKMMFVHLSLFGFLMLLLISKKIPHTAIKTVMYLSLCVCLTFTVSTLLHVDSKNGVVVEEGCFAFQGNGNNFDKVIKEQLPKGTEFKVLETRSRWIKVGFNASTSGWLSRSKLRIIE